MYAQCIKQINAQTITLSANLVANYASRNGDVDIVKRVNMGIQEAKARGADYAFIIEDDDWYAEDYFEYMISQINGEDIIGFDSSIYYNIINKTWQLMHHTGRSSLFCTVAKVSALDGYQWPAPNEKFLDLHLWRSLRNKKLLTLDVENPVCIGIKHNEGLRAGIGHRARMKNHDPEMEWLKSKVDEEAFEFYKNQK